MDIYRLTTDAPALPAHARSVAIGVFDGVHRAHREVIGQVLDTGYVPTVLSFAGSPLQLPKQAPALETPRRKAALLERLGVRELIELDFAEIRTLSPADFVTDVLCHRLNAKTVACGEDFRFGLGGAGNVQTLRSLCEPLGIRVEVVPTVYDNGQVVSSSRIRELIATGDMQEANRLLGHPYIIETAVIDGNHLGRTVGFPTVNQPLPEDVVPPAFGVYASTVVVDGRSYIGVTNIGRKPTVGSEKPLAETWIVGYEGDLYGQTLTLCPVKFLRPEQIFSTIETLFAQVAADAETIQQLYRPTGKVQAVLFDFDDTLHSRVEAWRAFSLSFVRELFPELPEDRCRQRAHELWELGGRGHGYGDDFRDIPYQVLFGELKNRWQLPQSVEQLIEHCHPLFALHTAVFADAADTLRRLRATGYKVGIITNGRSFLQNRKLAVSGLLPLLDCAVVAGDEGVSKPNAELFIRTAYRLGVPPQDCVYVGDNPVADIAGATAAGMRAVYIDRTGEGYAVPPEVPTIHTLDELDPIL